MSSESSKRYSVWRDSYFGVQGLFYFAQGVSLGALLFITEFLDYLGLSDPFERLVVQAIVWIPWYIKIVFGVLSDNVPVSRFGRRKPYIFLAGVLGAIGWLTLPLHVVYSALLLGSGMLAALGTSMSDAVIDAMAVDITPPQKRGMMQGVSWGSRGLGAGISFIAVGLMADLEMWFFIYAIPGIIVSLSCFLVLLFEERPLPADFERIPLSTYSRVFKMRNVQVCLFFQILAGAAIAILGIMQTFLTEELGFNNATTGFVFMVFSVGMFTGALIFGVLGDRAPVRITLSATTVAYVLVVFSALFINLAVVAVSTAFFLIVGFANGGYEATQMRISMDNSPSVVAGTVYNLYNSVSNIGQLAIGSLLIGALADYLIGMGTGSYQQAWQLAILFLLLALLPGYYLVTRYEPVGQDEDDHIALEESMV